MDLKKRLLNFGVIGVLNTILNVVVFNVLIFFGSEVGTANFISICVSIAVAYVLSSRFVFDDRTGRKLTRERFIKFIAVNVFTLFVIHQIVLLILAYKFRLPGEVMYQISSSLFGDTLSKPFIEANTAKALAVLASMLTSYVLYDRFVFKDKSSKPE